MGVLKRVNCTQWASPSFAIPKKDETVRFVNDFRELNKRVQRTPHPIPKTQDMLLKLEGFQCATSSDLNMGCHHMQLHTAKNSSVRLALKMLFWFWKVRTQDQTFHPKIASWFPLWICLWSHVQSNFTLHPLSFLPMILLNAMEVSTPLAIQKLRSNKKEMEHRCGKRLGCHVHLSHHFLDFKHLELWEWHKVIYQSLGANWDCWHLVMMIPLIWWIQFGLRQFHTV